MKTASAIITKDDEIKFHRHVMRLDDCWHWIGYCNKAGYGLMTATVHGRRTRLLTHRVSYYVHRLKDPIGYFVLHDCDNPVCCNPSHLYLGDQFDNQRDAKNRNRRAEQNGLNNGITSSKAKLSTENVLEILQLKSEGKSHRYISFLLGIPKSTIGYVCQGKTYKETTCV